MTQPRTRFRTALSGAARMGAMTGMFAAALFMAGFAANPAQAGGGNNAAAPQANAPRTWSDATPNARNSDARAVELVKALRKDLVAYYQKVPEPLVLYAYPMRFGNDPLTYIVARLESLNSCGTTGCQTYVFQNVRDNQWRQVFDQNVQYLALPSNPALYDVFTFRTRDLLNAPEEEWTLTRTGFARRKVSDADKAGAQ